jgi:RAP1 GTPase activating protein 1
MSFAIGTSEFRILNTCTTKTLEPLVEELEKDILWYKDQFLGREHWNFVCQESVRGPVCLSLVYTNYMYKAILRTGVGNERITLSEDQVDKSLWRKCLGLSPSIQEVLKSMKIQDLGLKNIKNVELISDITSMEEQQIIKSFKFGVLYVAQGQSTESQSISNIHENTSLSYQKFLKFLGEEIDLTDWKGYRGGLDTSGKNLTGKTSVYTQFQGYDIMFHISTLLPLKDQDTQKIERKRHIGNDVTIIIFTESQEPFQLSSIISKQNHVVVLVQPLPEDKYRITVAAKVGVPDFITLPEPPIISNDSRESLIQLCNFEF